MKNKWIKKAERKGNHIDSHFSCIPWGTGCVCMHPHCVVSGFEAESREPYEFVERFQDGSEIRKKLTHKEWMQFYLACSTGYYMPKTVQELEKALCECGCTCEQFAKPEGI